MRVDLTVHIVAGSGRSSRMVAVAMPLLGFPFQFWTLTPIGLAQLALVGWLLVKGFRPRDREQATEAVAHR